MQNSFQQRVLHGIVKACYEYQDNNHDFLRHNVRLVGKAKNRVKEEVQSLLTRFNLSKFDNRTVALSDTRLSTFLQHTDEFECLYRLLQDDYSKDLLVSLIRFRILGKRRIKLPRNSESYWNLYNQVDTRHLMKRRTYKTSNRSLQFLNLYHVEGQNGTIRMHCHELNILNTFLLEQYSYKGHNANIRVNPGDVVIDAGACWGDTSLYFADLAGSTGKVISFEFVPENLNILQSNLELNNDLARRIEIVPSPLWEITGQQVTYSDSGPATRVATGANAKGSCSVSTVTLTDSMKDAKVERLDFIKMDIEGSELQALKGAENVLRAFRPKLAISVYHKEEDLIEIPKFLQGLDLNYRFFLDHFSIHAEETVLFAIPSA